MSPARRWAVLGVLATVLVAVPWGVQTWPAAQSSVPAAQLLARAQQTGSTPWSGVAETRGTLQVPSVEGFDSVSSLFGGRTTVRAWWQAEDSWRVDRLTTAGESGLVRAGPAVQEWSYERNRVVVSREPEVRLPRASDLLPPVLGRRVLAGAQPGDVRRLPAERVAGRDALGLTVHPPEQSSVTRAEVWVDAETAVPLRVEVWAAGDREPSVRSEFERWSPATPEAGLVAFRDPPAAERTFDEVLDIADAADQYAPLVPPAVVAGLERRATPRGAVGVYGEGLVQVVAIPMRGREGAPLREQLQRTPGSRLVDTGTLAALGPLGILLTGEGQDGGWLVTGTVTGPTLEAAADDLLTRTRTAFAETS